ncbi:hypothetical protein [Kitasatospora aureofaciens]|uniref:hypothetical protein n=1 Tax=Kitasatospora aureofaciens TaxID=1894 RepID=UPI001C484262|nr:hypothetical protein [Kitasatospora aureofaciens]MBV6699649.1 hypothetical protein [Kitasatospora aureofaciens]
MALPRERQLRKVLVLVNVLALTTGLVCVVVASLLTHQQVLATVLSLIGGAFVSAAVVTLAIGSLTVREATEQVDSAVLRGMQDVLGPVRDPLFAGALSAYRYDCMLAPAPAGDAHPDYLYQSFRISYRVDSLPRTVSIVCLASNDDACLDRFTGPEYLLRWMIDDNLDPDDPEIFTIGAVRVDNRDLERKPPVHETVAGGKARIDQFSVPHDAQVTVGHLVELSVVARKFVGNDRRVRVQAQVFRHVTDAEYRLTIDPALKPTRLGVNASEISALGAAHGASVRTTFPAPFNNLAGLVQLPFPLQPGSVMAFTIDRDVS